jgi:hypothetical protein
MDIEGIRRRFVDALQAREERGDLRGGDWETVPTIPALCADVDFLYKLLADERQRYADLLAAV